MYSTRRQFLKKLGIGALATSSLLGAKVRAQNQDACASRRVNGVGTYRIGPFDAVEEGGDKVFLDTDLGFDETIVFCKVTTNFAPFRFPTATMDMVDFGAHEFYMNMQSTWIKSLDIQETENGLVAVYDGVLRSETRLFSGEQQRIIVEEASFGCHATQLSKTNVQISATNFSMTAYFKPGRGHAAIFGEEATFAGHIEQGSIIVVM